MSAHQINILAQINTLMVRRSIALGKLTRAYMASSNKLNSPEFAQLDTFARAAYSRVQFLKAQLG
jgi:hypothetical protein